MIQALLAEPIARVAIGMIIVVLVIAIILIIVVAVKVENACSACGLSNGEHLCGAPNESMCGCDEGLAGAPGRAGAGMPHGGRLAPHVGTYTRGPGAPYGAMPLPRPPESTFFARNHWRGTRWYGPPPSNYYVAHNWYWPGPTDIDAVYWDGSKYAPCSTCERPEDCRDCPAAKRWFRGW